MRATCSLGLAQWLPATEIGVHPQTYAIWERDENVPLARFRPTIIGFLGYDVFAAVDVRLPNRRLRQDPALPTALSERLRQRRTDLGLSRQQLAATLGVCKDTIRNWERGWTLPAPRLLAQVDPFSRIGASPESLPGPPLRVRQGHGFVLGLSPAVPDPSEPSPSLVTAVTSEYDTLPDGGIPGSHARTVVSPQWRLARGFDPGASVYTPV